MSEQVRAAIRDPKTARDLVEAISEAAKTGSTQVIKVGGKDVSVKQASIKGK